MSFSVHRQMIRMLERQETIPGFVGTRSEAVHLPHLVSENDRYARVVSECAQLADFPPGTPPDRYMGACYAVVTDLLTQDHPVSELVSDVLSKRDLSTKHFVNLFYRGVQYVELFERRNADYPTAYHT